MIEIDLFITEGMDDTERLIFNELYYYSSYGKELKSKTFEDLGIDKRLLAANVRTMNEKYKGKFFIGSTRKGYWLCRNEAEAIVSLLSYNQTILSSLGERKKIKKQIAETFGTINIPFKETAHARS
jgi:hypothetical protein